MIKVLFICHGNICRSPLAEIVFKKMVEDEGLSYNFLIDSAATSREEIGNPIYPPVRDLLRRRGVSYEPHYARQVTREEMEEFDYIVCMERYNVRNLERLFGHDFNSKISLLLDYTSKPGDVADPWYSGDFETTWNDVNEGCRGLLEKLK